MYDNRLPLLEMQTPKEKGIPNILRIQNAPHIKFLLQSEHVGDMQ
jgi:hypothetical protein